MKICFGSGSYFLVSVRGIEPRFYEAAVWTSGGKKVVVKLPTHDCIRADNWSTRKVEGRLGGEAFGRCRALPVQIVQVRPAAGGVTM